MRTSWDALRSVKRYVSEVLGETWDVQLWDEEGSVSFPYALVKEAAAESQVSRGTFADVTQPFVVQCYPTDPKGLHSVTEALTAFHETRAKLDYGLSFGVHTGSRRRIPLYDYTEAWPSYVATPLDQGSAVRNAHDYMRLIDLSFDRLIDLDDERGIALLASLRVTYRRSQQVPLSQKIVQDVRLKIVGR